MHQSIVLVCAILLPATTATLEGDATASLKERPVVKVVRLLKDIGAELSKELQDDKEVHKQLDCWCDTNDQEKTTAIALGDARQNELEASLAEAAATMKELTEKHRSTVAEIDADHAALTQATAIRMKASKAFHAENADMIETIKACEQAIVVLSEYHPDFAQVQAVARRLQASGVLSRLTGSGALELKAFLQESRGATSFLGIPGYQSYAPQSGQVFGILKQMKEDFESSLGVAQGQEEEAEKRYLELKKAKEEEIAAGRKLVIQVDAELADLGEKHAQSLQELADTVAQLDLDRTFLKNLKRKCSETDAEFAVRVHDRLAEIGAVEDTIEILNSDEAFNNFDKTVNDQKGGAYDVFDKSVNMGFFQISSSVSQEERLQRQRVVSVLQEAAKHSDSPKLILLASHAQIAAFAKVKEEIVKMVEALKDQQKDEVAHRDWCIQDLHENKGAQEASYDEKANLQALIAELEKTINALTQEIEITTAQNAESVNQMKKASENREGEYADYHQTISEQRLTQMILRKALSRMQEVYSLEQQPGGPHVELSGNHTDPGTGPARFSGYETNDGGSRVVKMLQVIIAESVKMVDDAVVAEEDAQVAYETLMKESNTAIRQGIEKINHMAKSKAKTQEEFTMAGEDLKQTLKDVEGLHEELGNLHKSCDFIMNNFDARQEARTAEIASLGEAMAILSGLH